MNYFIDETVLLSTHNIVFWLRNKNFSFCYALFTKGLLYQGQYFPELADNKFKI